MRKILAPAAIILLAFALGIWIVSSVPQPLPALVVVALLAVGALGSLQKRTFAWAGVGAVWAFYSPVLLALFQISIGMALIYGGLLAFIYGIWAPLLSSEMTAWLVRGRITESYPIQFAAPVLIFLGLAIFVAALVQIVRSKVRRSGLVTCGLYSLVRHPQYLGVNILALGFALYGLRPIDFIAWANLVFLHVVLANNEEEKLKEKFGVTYSEYQRQVPFILPFVPSRLRKFFWGSLSSGWRRKTALVAIYLLTLTILTAVLWALWIANGALLMR